MTRRYDSIQQGYTDADALRASASGEVAAYQTALAGVKSEAAAVVEGARQVLEGERQARLTEVNAGIAERKAAAAADAAAARQAAETHVNEAAGSVASRIVELVTGNQPSDEPYGTPSTRRAGRWCADVRVHAVHRGRGGPRDRRDPPLAAPRDGRDHLRRHRVRHRDDPVLEVRRLQGARQGLDARTAKVQQQLDDSAAARAGARPRRPTSAGPPATSRPSGPACSPTPTSRPSSCSSTAGLGSRPRWPSSRRGPTPRSPVRPTASGDELQGEISRLSAAAAEELVRGSLDDATHQRLIEDFIAKVGATSGANVMS